MPIRALQGLPVDYVPEVEQAALDALRAESPAKADEYRERMTVFRLRGLPSAELANVEDLEAIEEDRTTGVVRQGRLGSAACLALLHGLVGWRNLVGPTGAPVEFKGKKAQNGGVIGCAIEDLDQVPGSLRRELYRQVKRLSSAAELFR